jgi:hypothetical protein
MFNYQEKNISSHPNQMHYFNVAYFHAKNCSTNIIIIYLHSDTLINEFIQVLVPRILLPIPLSTTLLALNEVVVVVAAVAAVVVVPVVVTVLLAASKVSKPMSIAVICGYFY